MFDLVALFNGISHTIQLMRRSVHGTMAKMLRKLPSSHENTEGHLGQNIMYTTIKMRTIFRILLII